MNVSLDELLGKEQLPARIVPEEERKDTNNLVLKVRINSANGDKITVNLPMGLVKAGIMIGPNGREVAAKAYSELRRYINTNGHFTLVDIQSSDGDIIKITV